MSRRRGRERTGVAVMTNRERWFVVGLAVSLCVPALVFIPQTAGLAVAAIIWTAILSAVGMPTPYWCSKCGLSANDGGKCELCGKKCRPERRGASS